MINRSSLKKLPVFCIVAFAILHTLVIASFSQDVAIPSFWDKNEHFSKPDVGKLVRLRFLTTTDFPPFNYIDRKKRLSGFHIDLARAVCKELEIVNRCEIQALPWNELTNAVKGGQGEAILAGLAVNEKTREEFEFTRPYMRIPARFVKRKADPMAGPAYDALFRKKTGVIKGSSHAAYFTEVFSNRKIVEFATRDEALLALEKGDVDAVFSDGLSLAFWLTSASAKDCCEFLDGAYESEKYFGSGLAIAFPKGRKDLVKAANFALSRLNENGTFAELYLRYFPVSLF